MSPAKTVAENDMQPGGKSIGWQMTVTDINLRKAET